MLVFQLFNVEVFIANIRVKMFEKIFVQASLNKTKNQCNEIIGATAVLML